MKYSFELNKFDSDCDNSFDILPKDKILLGFGQTYNSKKDEWFVFVNIPNPKYSNGVITTIDGNYAIKNLQYWCILPNNIKDIRKNKIQNILKS